MAVVCYLHYAGIPGSSGDITEPQTTHGHAVIVLDESIKYKMQNIKDDGIDSNEIKIMLTSEETVAQETMRRRNREIGIVMKIL